MREQQSGFIVGEQCYLRGLTEADIDGPYFDWLNDYAVTRYLETGRLPNTRQAMLDYLHAIQSDVQSVMLAICDQATDNHVGNVALKHIHPVHRRADFSIIIGDKAVWGRGFATEATRLMVDYGFRRWNLHSIYLGVLVENVAAVRAYEKVGFRIDGTDREAWWADGRFHDVHRMSILATEYRLDSDQKERPEA